MIDLSHLKGARYGVFGLGRTGMAAVRALLAGGAHVVAWDDDGAARAAASAAGAEVADLARYPLAYLTAIVWSPGAPFLAPKPHPAASAARRQGVPLISDVQLLLEAETDATFVGVTGSNGKSTTTALIGHILDRAGRRAAVGGNLGPPTLGLETLGRGDVYVLELSSYQLELTPRPAFDVAVCLNLEPDHLDRHSGLHGYAAQKRRIFEGDGVAVVGVDDDHGRWLAKRLPNARRLQPISARGPIAKGVYASCDALVEISGCAARDVFAFADAAALNGQHNRQNAAAAYAVARTLDIAPAVIAAALTDFPGLPHRQELARTIGRVRYVNDSKATNAAAAARALDSFENIYWIAGGVPKDGGLKGVEPWIDRIAAAYFIGAAGEDFRRQFSGWAPDCPARVFDSLGQAVAAADMDAQASGEDAVVLLSPAAASFDQYRSYEARGDDFRDLVKALGATEPQGAAA